MTGEAGAVEPRSLRGSQDDQGDRPVGERGAPDLVVAVDRAEERPVDDAGHLQPGREVRERVTEDTVARKRLLYARYLGRASSV
jgi:hypothetical protein